MTTNQTYDVIVVGAGPSGLTTAAALARAGVRVLLLEKHPGLSIFPKATGLRPRSMEILRSWGLEAEILRRTQPTRVAMRISPLLTGPGQEVDLGLPTDAVRGAVSAVSIEFCPQDRLEHVLLAHAREQGAEVRFSTELVALQQDQATVRATVRDRAADTTFAISAQYLVGADGAHSKVRDLIGVQFDRLGSAGNHLSTLFRADLSGIVPEVPYVLNLIVAPGLEGMFVATGDADRWMYDIEWHPETGEQLSDWTTERITARLRALTGRPELEPEIIGIFPWDFGAGVARRQRVGRVFLVGDAAHRTTPRGATGMNTGIADAHNLSWKLAWVVRGWAGERLLDSYEAERGPVGRANAETSLETMVGRGSDAGLTQDFGVRYDSGAIVGGPLAGTRAAHAWVTFEGRRVSTIDLFDGRFTVLTGRAGQPWREVVAELAGPIAAPVSVLSLGVELADPDGELAERYGLTDAGCVVVRPDGYVAWDGADPEATNGEQLADALALASGRSIEAVVGGRGRRTGWLAALAPLAVAAGIL